MCEKLGRIPLGGGGEPVQQHGLGEGERAVTNGCDADAPGRGFTKRVVHLVRYRPARGVVGQNDDRVRLGQCVQLAWDRETEVAVR